MNKSEKAAFYIWFDKNAKKVDSDYDSYVERTNQGRLSLMGFAEHKYLKSKRTKETK